MQETKQSGRRARWAGIAALATAAALLAGCYHPHYYAHHRGGGYYGDDHRDRGWGDRRRYERHRGHRHHRGCGH